MKVLVCGGRHWADREYIYSNLDILNRDRVMTYVCTGGATGVDRITAHWAVERGIQYVEYPVSKFDWRHHGKEAGMRRNKKMLDLFRPDFVVGFPGNRGTRDMLNQAIYHGVRVVEFHLTPEMMAEPDYAKKPAQFTFRNVFEGHQR